MSIKNNVEQKETKTVLKEYEIAPISKFEFIVYLTYWMGMLLSGCYSVYKLAYTPATQKFFKKNYLVQKTYFGLYQSIYEYTWRETQTLFYKGWLPFTIYILVSRILRSRTSPTVFMVGCLSLSLYLNYYYSNAKIIAVQAVILIIPTIAGVFRLKSLVWISGLIMLYKMESLVKLEYMHPHDLFGSIYPQTALLITRAITVGLTVADLPSYNLKSFLELIFYYWYFPAIIGSRMMIVKDFISNIYEPYKITNWKKWFFLSFRITFWFLIWHIVSSLIPFKLILITHDIKYFNIFIVTGGQLFYGIHFGVIYIIIYNASYLITQLDGFLTADGPECICHIALYNRMWKMFDVAMHLWIKDHIFRPIIKLGDYRNTKFLAASISFCFVIIFHGLRRETMIWISLNIGQFIIYSYLLYGFSNSSWGHNMQNNLSPAWIRRITALLGGISWLSSIYGFGLFSYGTKNNNQMYMTFIKSDSNPFYYRVILFGLLLYSHSQMALTVNAYLDNKKKKIA